MSSDLERFRDHARRMATAGHQDSCRSGRAALAMRHETVRSCGNRDPHDGHKATRWTYCPGVCPGCVTDADRVLWGRMADEVDAYLTTTEAPGLFEDDGDRCPGCGEPMAVVEERRLCDPEPVLVQVVPCRTCGEGGSGS